MQAKVKSFSKETFLTKPPTDKFWDHTGEYYRKLVPGGTIWQWQHTGEITLKFDINDEIAKGKFAEIYVTLTDGTGEHEVTSFPISIVLKQDESYKLYISATLKEDGKRDDETWIINFTPDKIESIPPT